MNLTDDYTLTMAQSVGERILDPRRSEAVSFDEMGCAGVAVMLAQADGEIDDTTAEAFFQLIEIGMRQRLRSSAEARQEAVAWLQITEAEVRLPAGALSSLIN